MVKISILKFQVKFLSWNPAQILVGKRQRVFDRINLSLELRRNKYVRTNVEWYFYIPLQHINICCILTSLLGLLTLGIFENLLPSSSFFDDVSSSVFVKLPVRNIPHRTWRHRPMNTFVHHNTQFQLFTLRAMQPWSFGIPFNGVCAPDLPNVHPGHNSHDEAPSSGPM